MRLIDADALRKRVVEKLHIANPRKDITDLIDNAPTIGPSKMSVNVEYDVQYLPDKDGKHHAIATITKAEPSEDVNKVQTPAEPSGDLVSRQLIIGAIEKCGEDKIYPQALIETIKSLPSANYITEKPNDTIKTSNDVIRRADRPTVIRSKTLMPTKDFNEWAKRVRETNPNAVVIPCDAEVVSADRPTLKQTDTMIIADALRYLVQDTERNELDRARAEELRKQILKYGASMCHSADRPKGNSAEKEKSIEQFLTLLTINALSDSQGADRQTDEPKTEPAPVVAYICDRRRCAICNGPDGGCDHTTDIKHAAHFKNVAGQYFERPYMEEEDDG